MADFYTVEELKELGLKSCGHNVLLSKKASLYGINKIEIGNNVRIDDFCILSGSIKLGTNIHIAAYIRYTFRRSSASAYEKPQSAQ
jgi:galactoside O-acetyltransferase